MGVVNPPSTKLPSNAYVANHSTWRWQQCFTTKALRLAEDRTTDVISLAQLATSSQRCSQVIHLSLAATASTSRSTPTPSLASTSSSSHASLAASPSATILTEQSLAMPRITSSSSRTPPTRSVMMCSSATRMYTRVSTSTSIASPTERSTLPSTDRSSTNNSHS